MLIITNTETGKKYKVLRFDNIRKGDIHLTEIDVDCAKEDYPDNYGSFILEELSKKGIIKCQ